MFRFRQLIYLLLILQFQSVVFAGVRTRCETIRDENGDPILYRTIQWWEFDDYKIDGLTLGEAMKKFQENSGPKDRPEDRINVVMKWSQLTDVQKNAKIYMDGTGYKPGEIIHVLAMTLGLGYKVEEYAVVIGSRANFSLPKIKSTKLGPMLESIRTEPKILIRFIEE